MLVRSLGGGFSVFACFGYLGPEDDAVPLAFTPCQRRSVDRPDLSQLSVPQVKPKHKKTNRMSIKLCSNARFVPRYATTAA